ncbi:hypothetical protein [Paenibacillus abyssi]|uniref:Uncharacterized protein n=1 Tax=Paenibacillus abyssi TaxID=1340531 RepID=A0A917LFH2_9BACL|nr:hypothetical protein [Paenibacillus abyssi]GGG18223.1 hypothetical protein GCM10010916_38810 [Paenibacillus abyssi]
MTQLCFNLYPKYGPWIITNKGDQDCRELADRHYSRQTIGAKQFTRPGRNLVLRTTDAKAVWVTWSGIRDDGMQAYECTIFRNESTHLSSELIRWAIFATICEWGGSIPADGFITYVDDRKVNNELPGYCFIRAGWKKTGRSKSRGLSLFKISMEKNFLAMQKLNAVKELKLAQSSMQLALESGEWIDSHWFHQEAIRLQGYVSHVDEAMKNFGLGQLHDPTIDEWELQEIISPYEWFDGSEHLEGFQHSY